MFDVYTCLYLQWFIAETAMLDSSSEWDIPQHPIVQLILNIIALTPRCDAEMLRV